MKISSLALPLLAISIPVHALAQTPTPGGQEDEVFVAPDPSAGSVEVVTPEITVLGPSSTPRGINDYVPTVSELSGLKLEKRKQSTLGETLSREAGVSSTFFGPNSSRPVIRGLEGERVRILQNGIGTLDASGTSPDHAIATDPFLIDRVEIVRGSAALLYGSSAIGGVVNVINGRIPDKLEAKPRAALNSRFSSVDAGRSGGALARASLGDFTFHVDASIRRNNDYKIPGFARSERLRAEAPLAAGPGNEGEKRDKVVNSASNAFDGSLGASYVFGQPDDGGHLGASFSNFDTEYGTVAEENVKIDLDRYRLDVAGEVKGKGFIQSTRIKGATSYYKHEELAAGELETTFRNRATESRLDAKHKPLGGVEGGIEGIIGVQQQHQRFSVVGEEAFLPTTTNTSYALFAYEELPLGRFTPTLGLRIDRSSSASETSDAFGAGETFTFWTPSASAGLLYKLTESHTLALNASFTERAPNYQELFANGRHVATGIFEQGDRSMGTEIGRAVELSLRHKTDRREGRVSVYVQDFNRFIALTPTGADDGDADQPLPVFVYRPVHALFVGAEIESRNQLPWRLAGGALETTLTFDWVRGMNRTDSTNLPRITPVRVTYALGYRSSAVSGEVELQLNAAQDMVAPNELGTDSYGLVNLGAEIPFTTHFGTFNVLTRVNNVFNQEARSHVSFVKDIAPLPGRNFVLGLQARI